MKIINEKILSNREREIVLLILSGKNKREIANDLSLSVSTIKTNVENIYRKFDIHGRTELILYLIKNKFIEFEDE